MSKTKDMVMRLEERTNTPIDVLVLEERLRANLFNMVKGVKYMPVHIPVEYKDSKYIINVRIK